MNASGRNKNGDRNKGKSSVREEYGKRFNIWHYPIGGGHCTKDKIAYNHPAIFPEQLVNDHILSWSNEEDIVLHTKGDKANCYCYTSDAVAGILLLLTNYVYDHLI